MSLDIQSPDLASRLSRYFQLRGFTRFTLDSVVVPVLPLSEELLNRMGARRGIRQWAAATVAGAGGAGTFSAVQVVNAGQSDAEVHFAAASGATASRWLVHIAAALPFAPLGFALDTELTQGGGALNIEALRISRGATAAPPVTDPTAYIGHFANNQQNVTPPGWRVRLAPTQALIVVSDTPNQAIAVSLAGTWYEAVTP